VQTQTAKKNGTWTKTRLKNLLRHKSGRYYARAFVGGKEVWQALGTAHFSVAESKLQKFLEQYRSVRRRGASIASAKMTFDEAAKIHAENLERNVKIKQRTRDYWGETLIALYKSWPELRETQLRNIRQTDLEKWAVDYAKTASATRYNNTVHFLRHVLNVGVTAGVLAHNVASALHRISVKPKEPALPSLAQFNSLLHEMREGHGRFSKGCADLAAGLAFTGCRLGEARSLT
jgi:integrase